MIAYVIFSYSFVAGMLAGIGQPLDKSDWLLLIFAPFVVFMLIILWIYYKIKK
jgi:hypothetical protein